MKKLQNYKTLALGCAIALGPVVAFAEPVIDICPNEASRTTIHGALESILKGIQVQDNGGFGFHMWATVVNRDGIVCAVASSGADRGDQWPGSRAISAQKANTANAFSLPEFALSTAQLYQAVQPGGSLFGLQESNPVNTDAAYAGPSSDYGTADDPMVGHKIGGVNVFGGGLGLYDSNGTLLGALGVSGDSSCADHAIAWRMRSVANLDYVPAGPSTNSNDALTFIGEGAPGWEHPECGVPGEKDVHESLPPTR